MSATTELLIESGRGWQPLNLVELWSYRELLVFLAWRDITMRYKRAILGGLSAVQEVS